MTIKNSFHSDDRLKFSFIVACTTGDDCCENDCALSSRGAKRRGDLFFTAWVPRLRLLRGARNDKNGDFSFIVACTTGDDCCENAALCHREARSAVAISTGKPG